MEVAHIARDVERGDLPLAVDQLAEAACQPIKYQTGVIGSLARRYDILIGMRHRGDAAQAEQRSGFLAAQQRAADSAFAGIKCSIGQAGAQTLSQSSMPVG